MGQRAECLVKHSPAIIPSARAATCLTKKASHRTRRLLSVSSLMRTLILGVDSGTQSTKVVAVDARDGKVVGFGSQAYDLIPNLPPGAKEQHPHTWRDST